MASSSAPLPSIGVMPVKFQPGANSIHDTAPALAIIPFVDAFNAPYKTDAHFVAYHAINTGREDWPRCNKPVLSELRLAGSNIHIKAMVLDYDNPTNQQGFHGRWTNESKGAFLRLLESLADDWSLAWEWSLLYFTQGGARLVYNLEFPMLPEEFEPRHLWLCQEFNRRGIAFDQTVSDWTRCFRLPFVTRDKVETWEEDYAECFWNTGQAIDAKPFPAAEKQSVPSEYAQLKVFHEPRPDEEVAADLIECFDKKYGNRRQTDWFKEAKRRLKGRECFGCLFDHKPLAEIGCRDNTMHRFVGQVISLVYGIPGTTMMHVFGLFLDPVKQLEPDPQTPDWLAVLWSHIQRLWAKELAKAEATAAVQAKASQEALDAEQMIIKGMREWCAASELHSQEAEICYPYARRRMIVSSGSTYFVMGPQGFYDPTPLNDKQVIPRIRLLGLDGVIATRKFTEKGEQDRSFIEIINEFSVGVSELTSKPEITGAYIENMDMTQSKLVLPSYMRNKHLEPQYNLNVDTWLQRLFGDNYELGCKWISWSLAWDEGPICALSIKGKQGSGKKLLAQGLSECLLSPRLADAKDLTSDYQYGLMSSPFLVVNEGWPQTVRGMHPADSFRSLVSGDPIMANRRYRDPICVRSPVRVLFTANNLDVVHMLAGNRDLSPEDREALSIRLLHINLSDEASDWLRLKGGMKFTGAEGARWIAGDGGAVSDFVVAKHFLWLYEHRKGPVGARFLMEGGNDTQLMFEMRVGSGRAPVVIETLISMLQKSNLGEGMTIDKGELYVTAAAIMSHYRLEVKSSANERLGMPAIHNSLKGICKKIPESAYMLPTKEKAGRRRWFMVDCRMLLAVSQRDGWTSARLERIVAEQEERTNGTYVSKDDKQHLDIPAGVAAETQSARIISFSESVRNMAAL